MLCTLRKATAQNSNAASTECSTPYIVLLLLEASSLRADWKPAPVPVCDVESRRYSLAHGTVFAAHSHLTTMVYQIDQGTGQGDRASTQSPICQQKCLSALLAPSL